MGRKEEKRKNHKKIYPGCSDGKKPNVPLRPDLHCVGKEGARLLRKRDKDGQRRPG